MVFTSLKYFLFLAPCLVIYYIIPVYLRKLFLAIISILFIAYTSIEYTVLIILLIIINYLISLGMGNTENNKKKNYYLYSGLIVNLGVLIFFKYWNFIISNIFVLLGWVNIAPTHLPLLDFLLPIGLSYYTFQTIGYFYDVYRGSVSAERKLLNFGLFTIFFSKLAVGPIERSTGFLVQLRKNIFFKKENIIEGGKKIVWGLFKKLVVADRIAIYETAIFNNVSEHSGITLFVGSILYTVQVYADFSGYTDLALGTAKLFGYDLMENFRQPLFAKNIGDFWRRWHISLSSWVNDYIFNPIVFKRRYWKTWGISYGLFISFLVIGIWHGATWNYVLFGVLQAIALIYELLTKKVRKTIRQLVNPIFYNGFSILMTFLFVSACLIIFRFDTISESFQVFHRMFTVPGKLFIGDSSTQKYIFSGIFILMTFDILSRVKKINLFLLFPNNWVWQQISYALLITYILMAGVFDGGQFIYFVF